MVFVIFDGLIIFIRILETSLKILFDIFGYRNRLHWLDNYEEMARDVYSQKIQ